MALRSAVQGRTSAPRVNRDPSPFIAPQPQVTQDEEEEEEPTPPAQAQAQSEPEQAPAPAPCPADRPEVVHAATLKPSELKAQLKQLKAQLAETQAQREQSLEKAVTEAEREVNDYYAPRIRAFKDQMLELNRQLIESL
jgi:hypothetical protein